MKKCTYYLLWLLLSAGLFCCSQDRTEESELLCRVNEYNLMVSDFQRQLTGELELEKDFKLTHEAKRDFLEGLIRKELLIQEAKKLNLDRKEKFIRAIERYWESTLIRDLMDLEGKEIDEKIFVSQEEIEERYKEMKAAEEERLPLKEIQGRISNELKEKKKTRMLKEWISDLSKHAKIEVDNELLYKN